MTETTPQLLPTPLLDSARADAETFVKKNGSKPLRPFIYNPDTYTSDVSTNAYIDALVIVRHYLKLASDAYFSQAAGAKNVDLFMMTPSVSSPMGPGSDSEAVPIKFGNLETFLVDSSQFGFEPLLLGGSDRLYCYLPSIRGESPDDRHLNQFFHCEMEMRGTLVELKPVIESYLRALAQVMLALSPIISLMSVDSEKTGRALKNLATFDFLKTYSFDEAFATLSKLPDPSDYTTETSAGRDITSKGERYLAEKDDTALPVWIQNYDRNRVPFYQKPLPGDKSKVINADLLFPGLAENGFGGEVVGAGQRQDTVEEMYDSLALQSLSPDPYLWYINLRKNKEYGMTSGFGLGVERFIAWSLGYASIRDVILYPRLKNVRTFP